MLPLMVTLVVGLGRSEHKSRKEQSDGSSHDSQTIHGWSSSELLMHSGGAGSCRHCCDETSGPRPARRKAAKALSRVQFPGVSRTEDRPASRHFQVQLTVSESPSPEKTCAPNDSDELKFLKLFDVSTPSSLLVGAEILWFVESLLFPLLRSAWLGKRQIRFYLLITLKVARYRERQ